MFRVSVNENYEATCWPFITTKPYRDRFIVGIRPLVVDFWESHSRVIPDRNYVVWHRLSKGEYVNHVKHIVEMTEVALFKEF